MVQFAYPGTKEEEVTVPATKHTLLRSKRRGSSREQGKIKTLGPFVTRATNPLQKGGIGRGGTKIVGGDGLGFEVGNSKLRDRRRSSKSSPVWRLVPTKRKARASLGKAKDQSKEELKRKQTTSFEVQDLRAKRSSKS